MEALGEPVRIAHRRAVRSSPAFSSYAAFGGASASIALARRHAHSRTMVRLGALRPRFRRINNWLSIYMIYNLPKNKHKSKRKKAAKTNSSLLLSLF